jgi:hypothetical protein
VIEPIAGVGTRGDAPNVTVLTTRVTVKVFAVPGRFAKVTVVGDETLVVWPPQLAGGTRLRFTAAELVAVPPVIGVTVNQAGSAVPVPLEPVDVSTVKGVPRFDVDVTGTVTAGPGEYVVLPPEMMVFVQVTTAVD